MNGVFQVLKNIITIGLEYYGRYYSTYPGYVIDNNDPEGMGRLKLKVPSVYGDNVYEYWAPGKGIYSGDGYGMQVLPNIGDMVWVEFRLGDPRNPIWSHSYFAKGQKPEELRNPQMFWFKTPKGQIIIIDDKEDYIVIRNANNNQILIDGDGVSITTDEINLGSQASATGIVKEKAVMGQTLKQQLEVEKARLSILIQAIQNAPVTPGDGGAAFKASIIAAVSGAQAPDYSNILSDKVKLDK